jgi:predicted ArsR family transcriptional regulator
MREQILQMVRENPRTVKELADALGVSKDAVIAHLSDLPVRQVRTVLHNGRSRPTVMFQIAPS